MMRRMTGTMSPKQRGRPEKDSGAALFGSLSLSLQYNPKVSASSNVRWLCAGRPAVVQTAKTFQLQRNNAVTGAVFPQSFQQFCVNRLLGSGDLT
jgi:hypothetical protein